MPSISLGAKPNANQTIVGAGIIGLLTAYA
jgi:glycine/D-amino acid oxidase-like deaminating enzyme